MVQMSVQREPRFDAVADAQEFHPLDASTPVLLGQLLGRASCAFADARIENDLLRSARPRRVYVRHRLRGSFNGGLTRTLRPSAQHDAFLSVPKTNDRDRRDPEREHDGQDRLAALVPYGVHSTRRAAAPSMMKWGRPTNPSGTGTV